MNTQTQTFTPFNTSSPARNKPSPARLFPSWQRLTPEQKNRLREESLGLEVSKSLSRDSQTHRLQTPDYGFYLSHRKVVHPVKGRIPFALYPYQCEVLQARFGPPRLIVKARQVGVSQLIAGEALAQAKFFPGSTILLISRNLEAAQHLLRLVADLMASDFNLPEVSRKNESEISFANRSTIRSLAASENAGRTYAATAVYLDEFAHCPWAEEIYQAAAPTAARGGRLTIVFTPKGKANPFFRLFQSALSDKQFRLFRVHWSQCPDYNPNGWNFTDENDRLQTALAGDWYQRTRPLYTDEQWAQEFECDFTSSVGLVYREFDPLVHVADFSYNPDWPTYAAQDFGYTNPSVALFIQVSPAEEIFVFAEEYHTQRPISSLAREVYLPAAQKYRVQEWYCDPSGAGEIAELRATGLPAVARRSQVAEGILALRKLLRPPDRSRPRLFISSRCRRLLAEMSSYAYREGTETPRKDSSDHGPDALRYFISARFLPEPQAEALEMR